MACADLGVQTTRVEGRTGVWLPGSSGGPDRKVAAIGIRVSQGVTMHGFALNCDCDLTAYDRIVPCGHAGRHRDLAQPRDRSRRHRRRGHAVRREAAGRGAARRRRRLDGVTIAPDGRKLLRLEVRNAETPIERKPPWIKTRAKMGPEYTELQVAGEARGPAHGLPGGRLPQHLRVLGGPRGHLPHRRRPVHPALRLLPDRHRQAGAARPRRAAPGRRVGAGDGPALRHHHRRRPRRPARRRRLAVRRDGARDPRSSTPAPASRTSSPTSTAGPDLLAEVFDSAPRGARAQRRDGAADLQADPPGVPLRALARRAHRRPATPGWSPSPT